MKKILIIEDEENERLLYKEELEKENYQVFVACDGFEGINLMEQQEFDLIILDIKMPGMDGIETLSKILSKRKNVPVILYTSYPEYKNNFLSWAADSYLIKSSDLTELKETIKKLIEK